MLSVITNTKAVFGLPSETIYQQKAHEWVLIDPNGIVCCSNSPKRLMSVLLENSELFGKFKLVKIFRKK